MGVLGVCFQGEAESKPRASHSSRASWPLSMARCLSKKTGHSREPHESGPKSSGGGGWPVHCRHTSTSCCDARSDSRSREKAAKLAPGSLFHVDFFGGRAGSGKRGGVARYVARGEVVGVRMKRGGGELGVGLIKYLGAASVWTVPVTLNLSFHFWWCGGRVERFLCSLWTV